MFEGMYGLTIRDLDKIKRWKKGNELEVNLGVVRCRIEKVIRGKDGKVLGLEVKVSSNLLHLCSNKSVLNRP